MRLVLILSFLVAPGGWVRESDKRESHSTKQTH